MVQEISINIKRGWIETIKANIEFDKKICIVNKEEYEVNDNFLDELLDTIYLWKNEYGYDNDFDSEEFNIEVKTDKGKELFHGKGNYPSNYEYLKELLGDYHD